eukprot:s309_g14.t1
MVRTWAQKFTQVGLVLIGAGPPCQGVSGLNAARKGALRDERSCLFSHVARIQALVHRFFPWAQVQALMESVASMDQADEQVMSISFGSDPWHIDAAGVSLSHRPRLYWLDWEITPSPSVKFEQLGSGRHCVRLSATLNSADYLEPGWRQCEEGHFPTFTTSRPRDKAGYKPAGISQCTAEERERWAQDQFRFPPYQYQNKYCLVNKRGVKRLPSICEREVMMGMPKDYTLNCLPKGDQGSQTHLDTRLSLVGNSWNVTVVAWLMAQLGARLGLHAPYSVQDIVERTAPGCSKDLQTYLQRPAMSKTQGKADQSKALNLVRRMLTLVSMKGEDISLQASSDDMARYHRLRASIPARLWAWKAVASWAWTGKGEHINSLEMRAALLYSFFHSLLVPKAYAKGKQHKEHHSDGIDPSDLARLAACGAGG